MISIKVILSRIKPEDVGQDDKRMGGGGGGLRLKLSITLPTNISISIGKFIR